MMTKGYITLVQSIAPVMALCLSTPSLAQATAPVPPSGAGPAVTPAAAPATTPAPAPKAITPYADLRYRLELVDQAGFARDATASTLRVRAGLRTAEWHGLSAQIEGEAIARIGPADYNDTVNGQTAFPVVADPSDIMLNQAFVRYRPIAQLDATLGRQAINFDNQRWVGSVGWRQNDQTLDAVRVTARPVPQAAIDYVHSWRVNRIFGPDSTQGIWRHNDIHLVRAQAALAPLGTLVGYGYWLDIPASPALSSRTFGVRLSGEQALGHGVKLTYAAEYARQSDHGLNPRNFGHDYLLLEPGLTVGPVTARLGYERLEGDGTTALQTPLATLHAFNGWADKFLTTPAGGLRDLYFDATWRLPTLAGVQGASARVIWHDYNATRGGANYGHEWNALLNVPVARGITTSVKFAHYDAQSFATDTDKFWFSVEARF
ncbi:MAG: alginate export family protein [Sphingopyxis sp.]